MGGSVGVASVPPALIPLYSASLLLAEIGENQTYPYLRIHAVSDINKDNITNFLDFAVLAEKFLSMEEWP